METSNEGIVMTSLFEEIGPANITSIVRRFYDRVFEDAMIFHFFVDRDKEHLIQMQIEFVTGLLGGPRNYRGKPLRAAHQPLKIRPPHFGRRQVILKETLEEFGLTNDQVEHWLSLERQFKPAIIDSSHTCQS
jgi:hemoglobin